MKEMIVITLLMTAAYCDIRWQKIPNPIIVTGYVIAVFMGGKSSGVEGILETLACVTVVIGIGFFIYLSGAIGAGDIKLVSAIAGISGLGHTWQMIVGSGIVAGIYVTVLILKRGLLKQRAVYFWNYVCHGWSTRISYYDRDRDGTEIIVRLSPIFLIGYILGLVGRWRGIC